MQIEYELTIEPEQELTPEESFATGDDEADAELCREIRDRLSRGDDWAWFCAKVTARVTFEGEVFEGTDYLGACSYENERDFCQEGGYFADMKHEARRDLLQRLQASVKHGMRAARLIVELENSGAIDAAEHG